MGSLRWKSQMELKTGTRPGQLLLKYYDDAQFDL
jgi:hypothetical protein